jgi:transcriptional regulator with XRE-family HTH domain
MTMTSGAVKPLLRNRYRWRCNLNDSSTAGAARRARPGTIDCFVGKRIRQQREEMILSVKDIEDKTDIASATIERYEASQVRIMPMQLYQIAAALAVPIASFYADSVPEKRHEQGIGPLIDQPRRKGKRASFQNEVVPSRRETEKLLHVYYGIGDFSVRKDLLSLLEKISDTLRAERRDKVVRKP